MSNRTQYFIRRIIQNSKLNREKFVYNKNNFMVNSVKRKNSNNNIIKRNISTYDGPNNGGPNGPNMLLIAIGGALSVYIVKLMKK